MFFNHDYLTSKKAGLRVVWLASTLGRASRKLSRKDITSVNVAKTCDSVARPAMPLALRTSSHLMFGVACVYTKQAEYWMMDVQSHYNSIRKVMAEGGGSVKHVGGLVIVGQDTSTIDMPGSGRLNRGAITLPSRFDFFATHSNIDLQWTTNEPVGDSDIHIASLASIQDGERLSSPLRSNELVRGPRFSGQQHGRYTLDPSELRQDRSMSSPAPEQVEFHPLALMAEVRPEEAVDFGLDASMSGELGDVLPPLDDQGFDMQLDWQDNQLEPGVEGMEPLSSSPRRRGRSQSLESVERAPHRPKRTRFALADSTISLSNEAWLHYSRDIAGIHAQANEQEKVDAIIRRGKVDANVLLMGPTSANVVHSGLIELWSEAIAEVKAMRDDQQAPQDMELAKRGAPLAEAHDQPSMLLEDYDLPPWDEDPGMLRGGPTSPELGAGDGGFRDSQSSEKKRNILPWNQPLDRLGLEAEDATFGADTTSVHSLRSFSLETPTGLRRPSKRQSSVGAASVGPEAEDDRAFALETGGLALPTENQDVVDREVANFLTYTTQVRAQLPPEQPLFFSDLAPIADSNVYLAARAFYHTLALATANLLQVQQQSPSAEIKIELVSA